MIVVIKQMHFLIKVVNYHHHIHVNIDIIINTPSGKTPRKDEIRIRSLAVANRIPILTTMSAVEASIRAIRGIKTKGIDVRSLQEYHANA